MAGSTLKMRLGEDCLTDDGRRVRKDSPVYGEVRKIDGERVIVEIRTVNVGGNILPFKKEVYSSDAMEGIYVPGNAKAEINKDATAGAVDGTNPQIPGVLVLCCLFLTIYCFLLFMNVLYIVSCCL